jgi:hypothetical protein
MRQLHTRILGLFLLCAIVAATTAQAQDTEELTILSANYEEQFPKVTVTVRYTTPQAQPVQQPEFVVEVGDEPLAEPPDVSSEQGPLAVAIVADLSERMSDKGMSFTNRFSDMQALLGSPLVDRLQVPEPLVSLVVFTQTVDLYQPMDLEKGHDVNHLKNIVSGGVDAYPFIMHGAGANDAASASESEAVAPADSAPYPLEDAILLALEQFEQEHIPADAARALFVLAAGDPAMSLDIGRISASIEEHSTEESPLMLTVIAFGSDQEGQYTAFPANPTELQNLAEEAGGEFIHYFEESGNQEAINTLRASTEDRFDYVVRRADQYILEFEVDESLAGQHQLLIEAGDASDTTMLELAGVLPRLNLRAPATLDGDVELSVDPVSGQNMPVRVDYLLDGRDRPIASSQEGPDFVASVNTADEEFSRRFSANEYDLIAVAHYENGETTESTPVTVSVLETQTSSGFPISLTTMLASGVVALLLVVAGVGGWYYWSSLRTKRSGVSSDIQRYAGGYGDDDLSGTIDLDGDDATAPVNDDDEATSPVVDEEVTVPVNLDEATEAVNYTTQVIRQIYRVVVLEGLSQQRVFRLDGNGQHYFIGRPTADGKRVPQIPLPNPKVSRLDHAKLVVLANGDIELVAGDSENGTFVGEEQDRLKAHESRVLYSGDIFWISPSVKLRLEEIDEEPF